MDESNSIIIIGIDPSVDNLGFSIIQVCLETNKEYLLFAGTFYSKKMIKKEPIIVETHGERAAKLYVLQKALTQLFLDWQPNVVAMEYPFLGRFPQAYGALMEAICTIRNALLKYDETIPLGQIDPPTVKTSVGVDGRSKDKEEMREAVRVIPGMIYPDNLDMHSLDEHASDSIAVAHWQYGVLFGV